MKSPIKYIAFFSLWLAAGNHAPASAQTIRDASKITRSQVEPSHPHQASFVVNKGQWTDPSWYRAELPGFNLFVEPDGFSYVMHDALQRAELHDLESKGEDAGTTTTHLHAFRMRFVGGKARAHEGRAKRRHYHNYFLGNDPLRWKSHVPLYEGIRMKDMYEGIDIEAKIKYGRLKYDIVIAAHADPSVVQMTYEGLDRFELKQNRLIMHTSLGAVEESIPLAYQEIEGQMHQIDCRYKLRNGVVGFHFPKGYNPNYAVVIDPELIAATFSGSEGGSNYGHGAAYDLEGNIYTYGRSFSSSHYPVTPGAFQTEHGSGDSDAVVAKLNPTGSELLWASFLGGNGNEWPHSLVTNQAGEVHIFGTTSSSDFPVTASAFQTAFGGEVDIFIARFNADGSALLGSSYLGGSGIDGWNITSSGGWVQHRGEIMVNGSNHIYIASATSSQDIPTTPGTIQTTLSGPSDGLVAMFSPNLDALSWCTLLGGEGNDHSSSLRIHPENGHVTVVGSTESIDFPMAMGGFQEQKSTGYDAYILEISASGEEIVSGTFFGFQGNEYGYFLDGNAQGWAIFGTGDGQVPASEGAFDNGGQNFIARFNQSLTEQLGCAIIGAGGGVPRAFMMDPCGRTFFSLNSGNLDNVLTPDALFDEGNFYVGNLLADMSDLEFATFAMGVHAEGGTSRFDPSGIIYQGVCAFEFFFTALPDAWSTTSSGWDIAVFKIDFGTTSAVIAAAGAPSAGCAPEQIDFLNYSTGDQFIWDFGDGSPPSFESNPSHLYNEPGTYNVTLIAVDSSSCNISDTTYVTVLIGDSEGVEASFDHDFQCASQTLSLFNTTSGSEVPLNYLWNTGDGAVYTSFNVDHIYAAPGVYEVTLEVTDDLCGAQDTYAHTIEIVPQVIAAIDAEEVDYCIDGSVAFSFTGDNGADFEWFFGDDGTSSLQDPLHTYPDSGAYEAMLIATNPNTCNGADTAFAVIEVTDNPHIIAAFEVSQVGYCSELTFEAVSQSTGPIDHYLWLLDGDTLPYTEASISHTSQPGLQALTLVVSENTCQFLSDTTLWIEVLPGLGSTLEATSALCPDDSLAILDATASIEDVNYLWHPGGEETPSIVAYEQGIYIVVISSEICVDSLSTELVAVHSLSTGYRFEACNGFPTELVIDFPQVENVLWEDGSSDHPKIVTEVGAYPYSFTDLQGCTQRDTIHFDALPEGPDIEIPNVITPNNDGMNDTFRPQGGELNFYNLEILNRWGRTLFTTDEIYGEWDATNAANGEQVEAGTYFYVISYRGICQNMIQQKAGYIQVFRDKTYR